jgi:hypothetical protein
MNLENVNRASGAAIGFLIASVIFAVLVVIVRNSVKVPAIAADRNAAISQALYEIHTNEAASLNHAGWIDQQRGVVRLPIATAMKITAGEWQNPEAARSNLMAREEKATAPLPKAPAKANPFE